MATGVVGMEHSLDGKSSGLGVATAILGAVVLYGAAAIFGWPQYGTEMIVNAAGHAEHAVATSHNEHADTHGATGHEATSHGHEAATHGDAGHHYHAPAAAPPVYTVIPFMLLLGAIAVFPLMSVTEHWWESNLNRFKVAVLLALITLSYYAFLHTTPVEGHWPTHHIAEHTSGAVQTGFVQAILGNALLQEFIPFIVLLFSLYTISGGVRIEGDLRANPMTNATFMAIGGILASFIGTTGAAMLLIRPLLETNNERKYNVHTVVFFIFVVCNCGGCLLPIGDPPLFLGYLEGVDFWWTMGLWKPWMFVNGMLLLTYLLLDEFWYYRKESLEDIKRDVSHTRKLKISGLALNAPLLLGVVLAVALLDPSKTLPGTNWHPWMYLREVVQLSLVALALWWGSSRIREQNSFNYHAILEVAALFCGIFICMQPALQILGVHGANLGISSPAQFFWITGGLSSVLDNAPTYLVFFKTAEAMDPASAVTVAGVAEPLLVAISLGAVFMGAMTYIGNGPNFMVKAIAEKSGVKMPSFFGYMAYSCTILLPIMALAVWQFLL